VWNIFREIATSEQRWEIHGFVSPQGKSLALWVGRKERLAQVEALLWQGQLDAARNLLADCRRLPRGEPV